MLAAHSVTRTFRGGAGVRAVDLGVRSGEIHALVGLNLDPPMGPWWVVSA